MNVVVIVKLEPITSLIRDLQFQIESLLDIMTFILHVTGTTLGKIQHLDFIFRSSKMVMVEGTGKKIRDSRFK